MKPKILLATILAAATLAAAAALLFWREQPAEPSRPLARLAVPDLARIELDRDNAHVALERAGGRWRLTAPVQDEADGEAADDLARGLRGLSLGSEVSRDPAGYAAYEVNETSATRVRVFSRTSAAPILDAFFGKAAFGGAVYYRPNREAAVFLAEGVPASLLGRDAQDLRARALVPLSLGELERLEFFSKAGRFALTRSSGAWTASGRTLSADQAEAIVLAATSLRFLSFAPAGAPAAKTGLDRPAADLVAAGGGRSERIRIGREEAGRRYAEVAGRHAVGFISKYDADGLLKLLSARPRP